MWGLMFPPTTWVLKIELRLSGLAEHSPLTIVPTYKYILLMFVQFLSLSFSPTFRRLITNQQPDQVIPTNKIPSWGLEEWLW